MREHTIAQFCVAVEKLSRPTPLSDRLLPPVNYRSFKEQWIDWLKDCEAPGYYGRIPGKRTPRDVYQRLNNAGMIVWLNEAAGQNQSTIEAAINAMLRPSYQLGWKQTKAKVARKHLPWEPLAELLFAGPVV